MMGKIFPEVNSYRSIGRRVAQKGYVNTLLEFLGILYLVQTTTVI